MVIWALCLDYDRLAAPGEVKGIWISAERNEILKRKTEKHCEAFISQVPFQM